MFDICVSYLYFFIDAREWRIHEESYYQNLSYCTAHYVSCYRTFGCRKDITTEKTTVYLCGFSKWFVPFMVLTFIIQHSNNDVVMYNVCSLRQVVLIQTYNNINSDYTGQYSAIFLLFSPFTTWTVAATAQFTSATLRRSSPRRPDKICSMKIAVRH